MPQSHFFQQFVFLGILAERGVDPYRCESQDDDIVGDVRDAEAA